VTRSLRRKAKHSEAFAAFFGKDISGVTHRVYSLATVAEMGTEPGGAAPTTNPT